MYTTFCCSKYQASTTKITYFGGMKILLTLNYWMHQIYQQNTSFVYPLPYLVKGTCYIDDQSMHNIYIAIYILGPLEKYLCFLFHELLRLGTQLGIFFLSFQILHGASGKGLVGSSQFSWCRTHLNAFLSLNGEW